MSATLVAPPGSPTPVDPAVRAWPAASTPSRLRLLRALIVVLAVLAGVAGTAAVNQAVSGTDRVATETEPLLVNAEAIYTSVADADATAAQAFLSGGLEPTPLVQRYQADLQRAGEQLAQAAARAGTSGPAADAVRRLNMLLPQYAGLVQAARANNRQNNPVGVAYLLTASELARGTAGDPASGVAAKDGLLIAARDLFTAEQQRLADDYAAARAVAWWVPTLLLSVALLVVLLHTQRFLIGRTRRRVNVGLAGATLVVLLLSVLCGVLLALQYTSLYSAERDGSNRVVDAATARIAVLTQRGAESLTLAAHEGSGGPSERRFAEQTGLLFGVPAGPGLLTLNERRLAREYLEVHQSVRERDDAVDYQGAVELALGQGGATFTALDEALQARATAAQQSFAADAERAGRGLWLLLIAVPIGALLICALSVYGIHPRLEEYR